MDVDTLRKLVAMDPDDALGRFALGQKLLHEDGSPEAVREAHEHLRIAHEKDPAHVATYHVLAQALVRLRRLDEARALLRRGVEQARETPPGEGGDLVDTLQEMLDSLE